MNSVILMSAAMKGDPSVMSISKTWYTPDDAESKFGVPKSLILKWVEEGVVRSEQQDTKVKAVNGDDIELKIKDLLKKG